MRVYASPSNQPLSVEDLFDGLSSLSGSAENAVALVVGRWTVVVKSLKEFNHGRGFFCVLESASAGPPVLLVGCFFFVGVRKLSLIHLHAVNGGFVLLNEPAGFARHCCPAVLAFTLAAKQFQTQETRKKAGGVCLCSEKLPSMAWYLATKAPPVESSAVRHGLTIEATTRSYFHGFHLRTNSRGRSASSNDNSGTFCRRNMHLFAVCGRWWC